MKKPGFNNIDNVVAKRIKDSVLSDGEILVSGGAFEGNIDPLVESRIEAERAEIDSQMAQIELELDNKCDKVKPNEIVYTSGFAPGWSGSIWYRKNQEGLVTLGLDLTKNVDLGASYETFVVVPEEIRPSRVQQQFINLLNTSGASVANALATIIIYPNGECRVSPVTSATLTNARKIFFPFFCYYT